MKIEEGKFYLDAAGNRVGPMRKAPRGDTPLTHKWFEPHEIGRWDDEGNPWKSRERLVSEFTNEDDVYSEGDTQPIASAAPAADAGPATDVKSAILQEAGNIVNGARRSAYGTPEDNFARVARFWQAYFENTGRTVTITATDVSPMMRLLKEARLCESPTHRDSFVDLIGYALTGAEVNGVSAK